MKKSEANVSIFLERTVFSVVHEFNIYNSTSTIQHLQFNIYNSTVKLYKVIVKFVTVLLFTKQRVYYSSYTIARTLQRIYYSSYTTAHDITNQLITKMRKRKAEMCY